MFGCYIMYFKYKEKIMNLMISLLFHVKFEIYATK